MKYKQIITVVVIVFLLTITLLTSTPHQAPREEYFVVQEGQGLNQIITELGDRGYIYSPKFVRLAFPVISRGEDVKAGTYFFEPRSTLFGIINQLTTADYGIESIKVTLPEGLNVFEAALILDEKLPAVNGKEFLELAESSEGYLFPDTYLFSPNDTVETVYGKLRQTFDDKTLDLFTEAEIIDDPEAIYDTLKIASIIEEEAKNSEDRRFISGVIHNRLRIGMALQVDVTFQYINGKNTYELTLDDLKDPSLYNTYVHTGLPPTPISNPGLDSIDAALNPTESSFLFFLAGRDGTTYFSETFEEHVRKKHKYL